MIYELLGNAWKLYNWNANGEYQRAKFLRIGGGEMVKKREGIAAYFIVFSRIWMIFEWACIIRITLKLLKKF